MKVFECPHCNNQVIQFFSFFFLMGAVKKRVCSSCNKKLKVNYMFIVEFILISIISAIILRYTIISISIGEGQIPNRLSIALNLIALFLAYSPVWLFKRRVYMLDGPKA